MTDAFVVVSGIPASGKSALARQLAGALKLPVLDKDDFLEQLLAAETATDADRRRALSRASDGLFETAATAARSAILVSFWHVDGMAADSGTPTAWLTASGRKLVHVHCVCSPTLAAERYLNRVRHPGHRDSGRSYASVVAEFQTLAALGPPVVADPVSVDTMTWVNVGELTGRIQQRMLVA